MFGFKPGDFDEAHCELWPQNLPAFRIFDAARTQWRAVAGFAGIYWTGLDYTAVTHVAQHLGLRLDAQALGDIRILEDEALRILNHHDSSD